MVGKFRSKFLIETIRTSGEQTPECLNAGQTRANEISHRSTLSQPRDFLVGGEPRQLVSLKAMFLAFGCCRYFVDLKCRMSV